MARLVEQPKFLVSHVGYGLDAPKSAVLVVPAGSKVDQVELVDADGAVLSLTFGDAAAVEGWGPGQYHRIDLGRIRTPGTYLLRATIAAETIESDPLVIAADRMQAMTIADVTAYFRSQRSSGEIDRKDRAAHFYADTSSSPADGRPDDARTVDARGGWLDASGDTSKFLSHLTYTRMMSPQQIPLCAWALLRAPAELQQAHPGWRTSQRARLRDEGLFGADFLVRFQHADGFFYTGIFDALTKDLTERVITAPLQDSVRTQRWQAAYRHGGGLAIAALALASTADSAGDFDAGTYFAAAARGFNHLEQHNREYLFDGQESVIDDYCALLAAGELLSAARARSVDGGRFAAAAAVRAANLIGRIRSDENGVGYLEGDVEGRPYFHAAESGLPVIALLRYAEVLRATDDDGSPETAETAALALLAATGQRIDAVSNPFGLLRQRMQPAGAPPGDAFFFPHQNETGYWWQGENANLASVAYAATRGARLASCPEPLRARLQTLSADLLAWVLGLNPFDACMLQGRGHGAIEYSGEYQNSPGGILNGVTSGFDDENGIALDPDGAPEGEEWRWAEQWIPHSGWFVLAVAAAQ